MAKTVIAEFERRQDMFWVREEQLTIITDKANPFYEPRAELPLDSPYMVWLIESIVQEGRILDPLLVRKNGKDEDGIEVIEVVDGRQRLKALREVNRKFAEIGRNPLFVPVQHMSVTEEKDFFRIMATKNECKIKTPHSMLAMQIDRMIESGGTYKEAERAFFMPEHKLREYVKIARLCADVHKAVDEEKVPVSVAAAKFDDMSVQAQRTALKGLIDSGEKITAKRVDEYKRMRSGGDGGIPAPRQVKRTRTRAKIAECLAATDRDDEYGRGFKYALKWVLGEEEEETMEEVGND